MPVLTDLATVKTHLGIGDSAHDTVLTQLVDQVDELVANEIKRGRKPGNHPLESVEDTEYYDGSGREQLLLRRRPVTAVARVAVDQDGYYGKGDSTFPVADDWTEGTDFVSWSLDESEYNPGVLIALKFKGFGGFREGVWPEGRGNVLVKYTAGYSTIPVDLQLVANQLVSAFWNSADIALGGPLASVRLGDESYKLLDDAGGLSAASVKSILAKYKG